MSSEPRKARDDYPKHAQMEPIWNGPAPSGYHQLGAEATAMFDELDRLRADVPLPDPPPPRERDKIAAALRSIPDALNGSVSYRLADAVLAALYPSWQHEKDRDQVGITAAAES